MKGLFAFILITNNLCLDARQNVHFGPFSRRRPVCGSDGRTYFHERELYEHNCRTGEEVTIKHIGVCDRYCGYIRPLYSPVCGTDGITYYNQDTLDYNNCMRRVNDDDLPANSIAVAYWGPCRDECGPVDPTINEVCGSDGRFYSNSDAIRAYNCANGLKGYDKVIAVDASRCLGVCRFDHTRSYDDEYGPRCGSDGKTYYLLKELAEYNCKEKLTGRDKVKILHRGYCSTDCPNALRFWDPVCGCDGRTYDNEYVLDEKNCINEGTISDFVPATVSYKGKCDDQCHPGSSNQKPLCETDGITYENKKAFDYKNCMNKYFHVKKIRIGYKGNCYSSRENYYSD